MQNPTSTQNLEELLHGFVQEMCEWEKNLIEKNKSSGGAYLNSKENKEDTRNALAAIYGKFLTTKDRKNGRLAALDFGTPLAFDPEREQVLTTAIDPSGKKAIIETVYTTYAALKRRYTLKLTKDGWRIDKREDYSAYKEKWVTAAF